MNRIRLAPLKRVAPRCEDYEDESCLRAFEREMRQYRAHTEPYQLSMLDGRVDGAWRVVGSAGSSYVVDIVDRSGLNDSCSCPDFLTNGLGTCKHLEAVRRGIAGARQARAAFQKLGTAPKYPVITVSANGAASLQTLGRWSSRLLQAHHLELTPSGSLFLPDSAPPLQAGWSAGGARVVHAAVALRERLRAQQTLLLRRRDLEQAFSNHRMGTDVLLRPLFPYQEEGVRHLAISGRALLADDMGLGKTVQALAACEILRRRGEAHRILIVTPASLKDQWAKEIALFAGERAVVLRGGPEARRQAFASDAPYKILNYELTWRELQQLQTLDADLLVLDEAQRAKNFRTKTAITLRAIPSKYLFILTGTPVENRLDDLYSLLQLVDPDLLGPLWKFNLEFHRQEDKGRIVGYKNLGALRERIAPVVLRRRKEDVLLQLPPLTEQTRHTPLSPPQRELEGEYRTKASRLVKIAEHRPLTKEERERLMMYLLKARQACNALELCDPKSEHKASPKLDEFEVLVTEIAEQGTSKILVFSEWVEMLKLAAKRLESLGLGYEMLWGGVPTDKRPALLQRFREDPSLRVLLSSDAGGVGLNLQVASYVIHLDLPWNPGRLDQRTARAHRLGQTRGVSVTYLCAEEGIERGIEGTLVGKRAVREAALDPDSKVEELEAQSFSVFLNMLREVFEQVAAPGEDIQVSEEDVVLPGASAVVAAPEEPLYAEVEESAPLPPKELQAPVAPTAPALGTEAQGTEAQETELQTPEVASSEPVSPSAAGATTAGAVPRAPRSRAQDRLLLAEIVLSAGFATDALRAAYEAIAAAIGALVESGPPSSHEALVAAIYRELLPRARLPAGAHSALARLNDLRLLDQLGVEVDAEIARQAVEEARAWVDRLQANPTPQASVTSPQSE